MASAVRILEGSAGATFRLECTDEAQLIPAEKLVDAYGRTAIGMLISVEDGTARFGFGGTVPVNFAEGEGDEDDTLSVGHVFDSGEHLGLANVASMRSLRYIDGAGEVAGALQVTVEFPA